MGAAVSEPLIYRMRNGIRITRQTFHKFHIFVFMQKELQNKEQIFEIIQLNNQTIKDFGVKKIGLFGSFAKNQQTNLSDIDLLVEFEKGKKSYNRFIKLAFFLEELFGRKVDLITNKSLSPFMGPHILKETEYVPLNN